jgi:hypothetical protein
MAIQSFYTASTKKDFARLFQFRVTDFPGVAFGPQSHLLYVETATLPGRTINNIPVPYMGVNFNVPGNASYPGSAAYNVSFRMDADYDIRAALEASTFATFDDATSTGNYNIRGKDGKNILQLDLLGKGKGGDTTNIEIVRRYKLYGAYVVSTNDTQYDIKDTGTVSTCQAVIAYHFWRAGASTRAGSESAPSVAPSYYNSGKRDDKADRNAPTGWN